MDIKAIKLTLDDYAKAYCSKDIEAMMNLFDDSDNISIIGTGANELCVGQKEIKSLFLKNFEEATATKFEWCWIDIRISENHAVASVTFVLHLKHKENKLKVPIRWTVVLKNKNGKWIWIHRNASTAATNQDEGQAYPKDN